MGQVDSSAAMVPYDDDDAGDIGALVKATSSAVALAPQPVSTHLAEIDMQISTARRYPRDVGGALKAAVAMATATREIAESCRYRKPVETRQDPKTGQRVVTQTAEGESIRLAEIMVSCWGNLRYGTRIVEETDKRIVVEAAVHDLERNLAYTSQVQRSIVTRNGRKFGQSMIDTTAQAAMSIALRNAVFRVIPKAYAQAVARAALDKALGSEKQGKASLAGILARFKKAYGLDEARVLAAVGYSSIEEAEAGGRDVLDDLIGMGTALKDGDISVDELFGRGQAAPGEAKPAAEYRAYPVDDSIQFDPSKIGVDRQELDSLEKDGRR